MDIQTVIGLFAGIFVGAGGFWLLARYTASNILQQARLEADQIRSNTAAEAQNKAKEIELAGKAALLKAKEEAEREADAKSNQLKTLESRLSKREDTLDRKLDTLAMKEKHLDDLESKLVRRDKSTADKE